MIWQTSFLKSMSSQWKKNNRSRLLVQTLLPNKANTRFVAVSILGCIIGGQFHLNKWRGIKANTFEIKWRQLFLQFPVVRGRIWKRAGTIDSKCNQCESKQISRRRWWWWTHIVTEIWRNFELIDVQKYLFTEDLILVVAWFNLP